MDLDVGAPTTGTAGNAAGPAATGAIGGRAPAHMPASSSGPRSHRVKSSGSAPGQSSSAAGAGARDPRHGTDSDSSGSWATDDASSDDEDALDLERRVASNPDPFYDPAADAADDAWAAAQRSGRDSDAILSCPGCFVTLTLDCQQHEVFHSQFRAMLVRNVAVMRGAPMQVLLERGAGQAQRRKRPAPERSGGGGDGVGSDGGDVGGTACGVRGVEEEMHPVCCAECGTQVGAVDADEVYHFYNVMSSEA